MTLRQVLKTANRKGWIVAVPDMTVVYKASEKITHRARFSPTEYKLLCAATRERAKIREGSAIATHGEHSMTTFWPWATPAFGRMKRPVLNIVT